MYFLTEGTAAAGGNSSMIIMLVAMFAIMYFVMIRPQKKKEKKVKDMLEEMQHYNDLEQIYGYQYTGIMNEPGYRYDLGGEETEEFYRDYMAYLDRHFGFKA